MNNNNNNNSKNKKRKLNPEQNRFDLTCRIKNDSFTMCGFSPSELSRVVSFAPVPNIQIIKQLYKHYGKFFTLMLSIEDIQGLIEAKKYDAALAHLWCCMNFPKQNPKKMSWLYYSISVSDKKNIPYQITRFILSRPEFNKNETHNSQTLLWKACEHERTDLVKELLRHSECSSDIFKKCPMKFKHLVIDVKPIEAACFYSSSVRCDIAQELLIAGGTVGQDLDSFPSLSKKRKKIWNQARYHFLTSHKLYHKYQGIKKLLTATNLIPDLISIVMKLLDTREVLHKI